MRFNLSAHRKLRLLNVLPFEDKSYNFRFHYDSNVRVTEDLANFIIETEYDHFPHHVVEHTKLCVLDWLGAAFAGCEAPSARIVQTLVRELGGNHESTVIGTKFKTSLINAALANGVMGHAVELDDIHAESITHPAAPVIPAALACAEKQDSSGQDLIASIILGYDVEIRISAAIVLSHYEYWHPTGTCGTFGSVAAAGKILRLNVEEMINALGLAGTQASGLIKAFGTMSKPLNAGKAAVNGIIAALLAKKGFSGPSQILEGEKGFIEAESKTSSVSKILEGLGKHFEITRNIFKIHASCGHTHGAIDALLEVTRRTRIKPEEVDEILVGTYPIAVDVVGKNYTPRTASEAKFSLPYCLSIALFKGKVGLTEFSSEMIRNPDVLALAKKIVVWKDPDFLEVRLGGANVRVRLTNGREYSALVNVPKGYPDNPLTKAELKDKFRSLASIALPSERIEEIIFTLDDLEKLSNVKILTDLLGK